MLLTVALLAWFYTALAVGEDPLIITNVIAVPTSVVSGIAPSHLYIGFTNAGPYQSALQADSVLTISAVVTSTISEAENDAVFKATDDPLKTFKLGPAVNSNGDEVGGACTAYPTEVTPHRLVARLAGANCDIPAGATILPRALVIPSELLSTGPPSKRLAGQRERAFVTISVETSKAAAGPAPPYATLFTAEVGIVEFLAVPTSVLVGEVPALHIRLTNGPAPLKAGTLLHFATSSPYLTVFQSSPQYKDAITIGSGVGQCRGAWLGGAPTFLDILLEGEDCLIAAGQVVMGAHLILPTNWLKGSPSALPDILLQLGTQASGLLYVAAAAPYSVAIDDDLLPTVTFTPKHQLPLTTPEDWQLAFTQTGRILSMEGSIFTLTLTTTNEDVFVATHIGKLPNPPYSCQLDFSTTSRQTMVIKFLPCSNCHWCIAQKDAPLVLSIAKAHLMPTPKPKVAVSLKVSGNVKGVVSLSTYYATITSLTNVAAVPSSLVHGVARELYISFTHGGESDLRENSALTLTATVESLTSDATAEDDPVFQKDPVVFTVSPTCTAAVSDFVNAREMKLRMRGADCLIAVGDQVSLVLPRQLMAPGAAGAALPLGHTERARVTISMVTSGDRAAGLAPPYTTVYPSKGDTPTNLLVVPDTVRVDHPALYVTFTNGQTPLKAGSLLHFTADIISPVFNTDISSAVSISVGTIDNACRAHCLANTPSSLTLLLQGPACTIPPAKTAQLMLPDTWTLSNPSTPRDVHFHLGTQTLDPAHWPPATAPYSTTPDGLLTSPSITPAEQIGLITPASWSLNFIQTGKILSIDRQLFTLTLTVQETGAEAFMAHMTGPVMGPSSTCQYTATATSSREMTIAFHPCPNCFACIVDRTKPVFTIFSKFLLPNPAAPATVTIGLKGSVPGIFPPGSTVNFQVIDRETELYAVEVGMPVPLVHPAQLLVYFIPGSATGEGGRSFTLTTTLGDGSAVPVFLPAVASVSIRDCTESELRVSAASPNMLTVSFLPASCALPINQLTLFIVEAGMLDLNPPTNRIWVTLTEPSGHTSKTSYSIGGLVLHDAAPNTLTEGEVPFFLHASFTLGLDLKEGGHLLLAVTKAMFGIHTLAIFRATGPVTLRDFFGPGCSAALTGSASLLDISLGKTCALVAGVTYAVTIPTQFLAVNPPAGTQVILSLHSSRLGDHIPTASAKPYTTTPGSVPGQHIIALARTPSFLSLTSAFSDQYLIQVPNLTHGTYSAMRIEFSCNASHRPGDRLILQYLSAEAASHTAACQLPQYTFFACSAVELICLAVNTTPRGSRSMAVLGMGNVLVRFSEVVDGETSSLDYLWFLLIIPAVLAVGLGWWWCCHHKRHLSHPQLQLAADDHHYSSSEPDERAMEARLDRPVSREVDSEAIFPTPVSGRGLQSSAASSFKGSPHGSAVP